MDAIVSTRGTVSCARCTASSRPRSSLTSGGVSTPITRSPPSDVENRRALHPRQRDDIRQQQRRVSGESPGDPPSRVTIPPVDPTRARRARRTRRTRSASATARRRAIRTRRSAHPREQTRRPPRVLHSGGGGGGGGVVVVAGGRLVSSRSGRRPRPPRRGELRCVTERRTPPAVHPRRRAPSPDGAGEGVDGVRRVPSARTTRGRARASIPRVRRRRVPRGRGGRGPRPRARGATRPRRSSRASSRAARNGRKGASGAMKRSRSSPAAGRPSCRVDARVGILSAVADIATTGAVRAREGVVVGAMMREEGCVGGDVTARVGSPHAHRRGEPDGALGDVRVVAPHRSGPTPRLDGVQPTASAATTGRCYLPLRQTARFFPIARESRTRHARRVR